MHEFSQNNTLNQYWNDHKTTAIPVMRNEPQRHGAQAYCNETLHHFQIVSHGVIQQQKPDYQQYKLLYCAFDFGPQLIKHDCPYIRRTLPNYTFSISS